jgi:hypothetical protein
VLRGVTLSFSSMPYHPAVAADRRRQGHGDEAGAEGVGRAGDRAAPLAESRRLVGFYGPASPCPRVPLGSMLTSLRAGYDNVTITVAPGNDRLLLDGTPAFSTVKVKAGRALLPIRTLSPSSADAPALTRRSW